MLLPWNHIFSWKSYNVEDHDFTTNFWKQGNERKVRWHFLFFAKVYFDSFIISQDVFRHSVEISWFFHHSDFTWNQFLGFYRCKICHFDTFTLRHWIWIFMNFWALWMLKFTKLKNSELLKTAKTVVLELLYSQKLISHKIWMIEKSWNFDTMDNSCFEEKEIELTTIVKLVVFLK